MSCLPPSGCHRHNFVSVLPFDLFFPFPNVWPPSECLSSAQFLVSAFLSDFLFYFLVSSVLPPTECLSSAQFRIEPAQQDVVAIGYDNGNVCCSVLQCVAVCCRVLP